MTKQTSFHQISFAEKNQLPGIDHLTGIADRNILQRQLLAFIQQNIPFSFLLLDIENFAFFNQELEPIQADQILKRFAAFLHHMLKPEYKLGRWQGNCFAIALPHTNLAQCEAFSQSILLQLKTAPWQMEEMPVQIHIAMACCPPGDLSTLITQAEQQLSKEKQQKKMPAWLLQENPALHNQLLFAFLTTRDPYYQKFTLKTIETATKMAQHMEMSPAMQQHLQTAALWQDTGMVEIPGHILMHPGPLPEKYWNTIIRHPLHSSMIAEKMELPAPVITAILHHHEKWDGSGYPHHLQGTQIPLLARILHIAGAWSAMQFPRPYRKQLSHSAALEEIYSGRNKAFDPHLISIFRQAIL